MYNIDNEERLAIIKLFNQKPIAGVNKIREILSSNGISNLSEQHQIIGQFLYLESSKNDLNLQNLGDYLGTKEIASDQKTLGLEEIRKSFLADMDFTNIGVAPALRQFLRRFSLTGEGQKIDLLMESFANQYCQQNTQESKDAIYILSNIAMILTTTIHNPNADKTMLPKILASFKAENDKKDEKERFTEGQLDEILKDVKENPYEVVFSTKTPGFTISSSELTIDRSYSAIARLLNSPSNKMLEKDLKKHFALHDDARVTVHQPLSIWHSIFGYEGTVTISNDEGEVQVSIYKPNIFSQLFGIDQTKITVIPVSIDYSKGAREIHQEKTDQFNSINEQCLSLASKIAATFTAEITEIEATYDYQKNDLNSALKIAQEDQKKVRQ